MNISETVKSFLEKYGLENKRLIVGFSGGYDSLCLLDVLNKPGISVIAVHLNHNWRGEESRRDENFCRDYCKNNGIEFYTETLSPEISHTETAAREARYEFFERCAKKFNAAGVLTAHNLDDLAETVIYRVLKGTGVEGLRGISENRGIYYRPLLSVLREDIEAYCRENGLEGVTDSSNNDTAYRRNFIRHKLLPLVVEINQNYRQALRNLAEIADDTTKILGGYVEKIQNETGNSTQNFINLGKPAQNALIYEYFKSNNLEYDRKKIQSVVEFINENAASKSGRKASVTKDLWIFANCKKFEFLKKTQSPPAEVRITKEGEYNFGEFIFTIEKAAGIEQEFPKDSEMKAFVELKEIDFTLRNRQESDIIRPLGCTGSQKLKKYFNEKKIPNHEKGKIALLCRGNEVLWAAGLGLSEKIKVVNRPTHVLKLRPASGSIEKDG